MEMLKRIIMITLLILPFMLHAGAKKLPHVVVVTTGGTVAMKYDKASGGVVPAVSGKDLIEAVHGLDKLATIETFEFSNIDSSHAKPENWQRLSKKVDEILARDDVAGVVVTHGTDTMEEGVFFLETTLKSTKPVVFVGAMRSASDLSADGPANIYNAVLQITSDVAKEWGVTINMNQYINAARHVQKAQTTNPQTFTSGEYGYLGYVVNGKVIKYNDVVKKEKLALPEKLPEVPLFVSYPGDDGRFIKYAVDTGAKGIAVAGVGAGNVNPDVLKAIEYALSKNVPVVVGSRVFEGGVYPLYGSEGGGSSLLKAGAFLSGDLTIYKARLLLMIALGQKEMSKEKLAELFTY
jgi:L-asparaginase